MATHAPPCALDSLTGRSHSIHSFPYPPHVKQALSLNDSRWTLYLGPRSDAAPPALRAQLSRGIPASGCIHLDLLAAGLIPDPAESMHELDVQWVGECDWIYRCEFTWPPVESVPREGSTPTSPEPFANIDLVFDALDTFATISLNGIELARTESMYVPHRLPVATHLRTGINTVDLAFEAPLRAIRQRAARFGPRPVNGDWEPFNFARRPACNFGWDWGPKLATCGLGNAFIERWSAARIEHVRPLVTRADESAAALEVHVDLALSSHSPFTVIAELLDPHDQLVVKSQATCSADTVTIPLHITNPQLWWPRPLGPQPLYTLRVSLTDPRTSATLDQTSRRVGLRTISLNTSPDRFGESFELRVNNRRVFMQGANWIPEGLWPLRAAPDTVRSRIQQAADANMNTLRVWGGGCYEPDSFYDACDELGILVWQDFMFACAMYPEEEPYRALVEREARHHVARLSSHPSVALWCGGNECVWGYENWGWKQRLAPDQSWGAAYYFGLLPRIVDELDPTRPYWANSPWSRDATSAPNSPDRGDRHTWEVQGARYREVIPRACTEFGHQSVSTLATLRKAIPAEYLRLWSDQLAHRQRATGGHEPHHLAEIRRVYGEPRDFEHWHDLALRAQARALSIGVEWLRANQPRCSAALIWQLNDAWAGFSWSLIDAAGRRKPAWHAVRRSMSPRLLTIQPIEQRPTLIAINDTARNWSGHARVRRVDFDGTALRESHVSFNISAGEVRHIAAIDDLIAPTSRPWREIVVVDPIDSPEIRRATWLYHVDRELHDPPPAFTWSWRESGKHDAVISLTATSFLRDIIIHADRADAKAECDANFVTLLPGESFDFPIIRPPSDPSRLVAPDCLTTARAALPSQ